MNSYVMITGATGGLGRAFVSECAKRGNNIFLTDVNEDSLKLLADNICNQYEVDVQYNSLDFTDKKAFQLFWEHIETLNLKFHMLVNVAGGDTEMAFYNQNSTALMNILIINVHSVIGMTREIIDYRDEAKTLNIINISSMGGFYPMPLKSVYSSSKGFITSLSLALNYELKKFNTHITTLCPSGMPTTEKRKKLIAVQGLMGRLTTQEVERTVSRTIDKALKGKSIYVPGIVNKLLRILGSILPNQYIAYLIYNRWEKTGKNIS